MSVAVTMLAEYENNIKSLTKSISDNISELESYTPDDPDSLIDKITADLRSAKAELTKFKSFTAGLGRADKDVAVSRYGNLNKLVSSQQRQLDAVVHKLNASALGGGGGGAQYRDQVDEQNRMLERSSDRLKGVKSSLAETEDHAITITTELDRNRKTIMNAKSKVDDTQMELKGAGRVLNRMFVRNVKQRASIFGMLVVGGLIILLVLIACFSTGPYAGYNASAGV